MKISHKIISVAAIAIALGASTFAFAASSDPAVVAGRQLWNELQTKQVQCNSLSNTDFQNLGEYFMDQMMDGAHETMDRAVQNQSGQAGLDAMHLAMGERFSGCNSTAAFPAGMMGGHYDNGASSTPYQNNFPFYNMMGYGYGGYGPMMGYGYASPFGWIFMVLFWVLLIIGLIALIRWLGHGRGHWHDHGRAALDVLKERYAKGEIDKKEFEEKKKDLA